MKNARRINGMLLALAMVLMRVSSSPAEWIVDVAADTYVHVGSPDTNFGSSSDFQTANDGGTLGMSKTTDKWSIFRFDVSEVPAIGFLTGASLSLQKVGGSTTDYYLYGVPDTGADESFDELAYTYNNSSWSMANNTGSGFAADGGLYKTGLTELGQFSVTATNPETLMISGAAMTDFLNADTNDIVTFILWQNQTGTDSKQTRSFTSGEASTGQAPQLTLIPEPATTALLGWGVALSLLRRRRRSR